MCVCSHTPPCSPVHETRAAALNVSINHPWKKISIFKGFQCTVLRIRTFPIQLTPGFRCERKWSLKWQISQSLESNGNNISSAPCQIRIKSAQMDLHLPDTSRRAASPAAHFLVEIKQSAVSFREDPTVIWLYIRPYVSVCAGPTCTDRRRLWGAVWESGNDPPSHLSKNGSAALCGLPFGGFGSLPRCHVPPPHLSPQPGDTHDPPDLLCHRRIN